MNSQIQERDQIADAFKWNLQDLYPDDAQWESELCELDSDKLRLMQYAGHLGENAQMLFQYLVQMEKTNVRIEKLAHYCMRKADQDTADAVAQAMVGRFFTKAVELETACSFETPEIMELDDATLDRFFTEEPQLERYRRYLFNMLRRREHVLSESEERILSAAGELAQLPDKAYGVLTDSDMRFKDAVDAQNHRYPLSQATFVQLQESPDRVLRKSAYENFYDGFIQYSNTAAGLLDGQNKQLKFFAKARRYNNSMEASLDATNVPVSVYQNLITTVHEHVPKMHRYIRLRKKLLGLDDLHFYDIYTPLVKDVDKTIPFHQAKETVLEALKPLGEDYCKVLQQGFDGHWIDVYPNKGKRSGAYSAGATVHPYVLLNYTGTLDSQFTLAHEMGHALHSYLSNKHQNPVDADYVIFVAEVASTCNEALLMEFLLRKTQDKKERAYLINHFLDQFKGTLFRQTMFAEFEANIGKLVDNGDTLTTQTLSQEYARLNCLYYGPDIVVDDRIGIEWARIPHFYYNYYVFQYATGYCAAIALSRKILKGDQGAVEAYLNFLSSGCSAPPVELLRMAGVDMTTEEPITQAMNLFEELLDEMETLMEV